MHPPAAPLTPVQRLAGLMTHIALTLAGRVSWTTLPPLLVGRVTERFRRFKLRIERIASLVREGRYKPRNRPTPPRPAAPGARTPPSTDPAMRTFGWLGQILPDMPPLRGGLLSVLRDPEMEALIRAAPIPVIPPLRSLCRMMGLPPPPILALPRKPNAPKAPKSPEALAAPAEDRQTPEPAPPKPHSPPRVPKLPGPRWPKGARPLRRPYPA